MAKAAVMLSEQRRKGIKAAFAMAYENTQYYKQQCVLFSYLLLL